MYVNACNNQAVITTYNGKMWNKDINMRGTDLKQGFKFNPQTAYNLLTDFNVIFLLLTQTSRKNNYRIYSRMLQPFQPRNMA